MRSPVKTKKGEKSRAKESGRTAALRPLIAVTANLTAVAKNDAKKRRRSAKRSDDTKTRSTRKNIRSEERTRVN